MINEINSANTLFATSRATAAYSATPPVEPPSASENETPAVEVELSEKAQKTKTLLENIPRLSLDPAVHIANAEKQFKDLMNRMGIPADTEFEIEANRDGSFTVTGDNPRLKEIEEKINDGSERELRNSLVGAHTGSIIQRIGAAVEKAMTAADANPGMTDTYYDWVLSVANGAKSMGFSMTYADGSLSGSLVNGKGEAVAAAEGLTLPT